MRGMKEEIRDVYYDHDQPVEKVIEALREAANGLTNPRILTDYEDAIRGVAGWRPMTPKEKEAAKRRAEAARKAKEKRKLDAEEYERRELARLKAKYEEQQ